MEHTPDAILARIEEYLEATGLGTQEFAQRALGTKYVKLIPRLRAGKGINLLSLKKIDVFMRENPPAAKGTA